MKKSIGFPVSMPVTASDWELFTASMKCDGCAKRLTAALKKELRRFAMDAAMIGPELAAQQASYRMHEKLDQEAKYGAADSEPIYHADQTIIDYGRMLGYEMKGKWF